MPDYRLLIPEAQRRRLRRNYRLTRAAWRTLRVVWREFRVPILVFSLAIFIGGWAYWRLWNAAYPDQSRPYFDMPYIMVSLMLLAAEDIPRNRELALFWYMMPLLGIYGAARGVFDFVTLFWASDERRRGWEVAVASTYNNHVIVLGVGHLGTRVVRQLVRLGFDVVAIDLKPETGKLAELDQLGVPLVQGDGRLEKTLQDAAIRRAQALIVCTSNDHMNLEVTMNARDLNPDLRIVVRMWDDRFARHIGQFLNAEAVLSATNLAAPSFAAAALGIEITQTMVINGEEYSMIRLQVAAGSFLEGKTVDVLQEDENMDIVLHGTPDGVQVHPAGENVVRAGDTLVLFARHSKVINLVERNRRQRMTSV